MPVPRALTPRQLRTIADRVERLTKARIDNEAMGVPTTPDTFDCRFPSGHRGTVTWEAADLNSASSRARNQGQPVRRYVVELHDPTEGQQPATVIDIRVPAGEVTQSVREALARMRPGPRG